MGLSTATSSLNPSAGSSRREPTKKKRFASALFSWIDSPARLTTLAMLTGWIAVYFAYQDKWIGLLFAVLCTLGGFVAVERGRLHAQTRSANLRLAIDAAAA